MAALHVPDRFDRQEELVPRERILRERATVIGVGAIDLLEIMARIIIAAISRPMFAHDMVDALAARGEYVEP